MPANNRLAASAFVLLIAATSPALANWDETQWGMSPEDALAALDGATSHAPDASEIYEDNGQKYAPLVKLSRPIEGIDGQVSLLFDGSDKLHFVLFNPDDITDCDALGAALSERYGEAEKTGAGGLAISTWAGDDNAVKLTNFPAAKICNLSYSAI